MRAVGTAIFRTIRRRTFAATLLFAAMASLATAAAAGATITSSFNSFVEGTNPQFQHVDGVDPTTMWVNLGQSGSFDVYVDATGNPDPIDYVQFDDFPGGLFLAGWLGGGGDVLASGNPYHDTYTWTVGADDPVAASPMSAVVFADVDSDFVTFSVKGDTTAPTGGSVAIADGYRIAPSVADVDWDAGSDNGESGIGSVQVQRSEATLSGGICGGFGTFTNVGPVNPADPFVDTTVASGMCYRYQVVVTDNVGNSDVFADVADTAMIDVELPTGGAVSYPNAFQNTNSATINITAATDALSGIASSELQVDTATLSSGICSGYDGFAIEQASPGASYNDTGLVDGTCYKYRLAVSDNAGNTAYFTSANEIKVDLSNPTGTVSASPASPWSGTKAVTGTASDAVLVDHVDVTYTGPMSGNICLSPVLVAGSWSCNWDTSILADGAFTVSLLVTDVAGNTSSSITRVVTVDNTMPAVTFTAPPAIVAGSSVSLDGTSADAQTAVDDVTVTYDGPGSNDGVACNDTSASPTWSCTWDTLGVANGTYVLTATATDAAGNTNTAQQSVDVLNPAIVLDADFAVSEAGATDTVDVTLSLDPGATGDEVVVDLTDNQQVDVTPAQLTFNGDDWNVPQTLTITAIDDAIDEADPHAGSFELTSTSIVSGWDDLVATGAGTVADDDADGILVTQSGGTTTVAEAGATSDTFDVVLTAEPSDDVVVDLAVGAQVTRSPGQLTFTSTNWNTPQTVTLTAVDDDVDEADPHADAVAFTVSSADVSYDGMAVANVPVSVADDDTANVVFTEDHGGTSVVEGGATDLLLVHLGSKPASDVTVQLGSEELLFEPSSLTFTPANWNVDQQVTVSAVDDGVAEGEHDTSVEVVVSSTDPDYDVLEVTGPTVSIADGTTDELPPTALLNRISDVDLDGIVALKWSASDIGGGPFTYELQSRSATSSGSAFTPWRKLFGPTGATTRTVRLSAAGNSYCFRVVAVDGAGNESAPSAQRCTAVPLDDRVWPRTRGWSRIANRAALHRTLTSSTRRGSFLTLRVTGERVGVLVTKCRTCGSLRVTFGTRVLGTYNLRARRTSYHQLLRLPALGGLKRGRLRFQVVTNRRPVQLDGVVVWRD